MKKALFLIGLLSWTLFSQYSLAQAREWPVNSLQDTLYVGLDAKNFEIQSFRIAKVPSKMSELNPCRSRMNLDIEVCEEVIEKIEVVQIDFWYEEGRLEDNTYRVDINLPMELFSANEIAEIRRLNKGVFDFSGKKTKALKKMVRSMIGYKESLIHYKYPVEECVEEHRSLDICKRWVVVGEKDGTMKKLQFYRQ